MTEPGLLQGLPGGHAPLMAPDDPRLTSLIQRTEDDPSALLQLMADRRARKVGPAFEALVQWGLEEGLGYRCLAWDVQVFSDKRTIGAMDLLLESPGGECEHWELAYKVYLQVDPGVGWESWVGPGHRDRLNLKVRRLLDHQLPLSTRPEAVQTLSDLGIQTIARRRILLQGVLFTQWGTDVCRATQANLPAQGLWLRESQLDEFIAYRPDSMWASREKPLWFGPFGGSTEQALSSAQLQKQVREEPLQRAHLWSRLASPEHPAEELVFIVPEQWGTQQADTA
jgi:hypothetical protein